MFYISIVTASVLLWTKGSSAWEAATTCNQFKYIVPADAGELQNKIAEAVSGLSKAAGAIGKTEGGIRSAIPALQSLADVGWGVPGIRWNLGAAYLELKDYPRAEKNINSELTLLSCLDRESDDKMSGRFLVDPSILPAPSVRESLKRNRAFAEYNLAAIYAQQGRSDEAFLSLGRSIENGFPGNGDELAVLERDRNLAPLRNLPPYDALLAPLRRRLEH